MFIRNKNENVHRYAKENDREKERGKERQKEKYREGGGEIREIERER